MVYKAVSLIVSVLSGQRQESDLWLKSWRRPDGLLKRPRREPATPKPAAPNWYTITSNLRVYFNVYYLHVRFYVCVFRAAKLNALKFTSGDLKTRWGCFQQTSVFKCDEVNIDIYPPQNEKLTVERAFYEDSMSKLRKVNAELRVGKDESFGLQVCGLKWELKVRMFAGRTWGKSGSFDAERHRNHKGWSVHGPQRIVPLT